MPDQPQNVWQFLLIVFSWIDGRITRALALLQGTLALIAAQDNLLTKKQVAGSLLAIAVLTYWRGQATSKTYATATAIVKQDAIVNPTPPLPATPPVIPSPKVEVFK